MFCFSIFEFLIRVIVNSVFFLFLFFLQQTIRELFDVSEGEKKETESSVPPSDDEETVNKQQTNILEQVSQNLFFSLLLVGFLASLMKQSVSDLFFLPGFMSCRG